MRVRSVRVPDPPPPVSEAPQGYNVYRKHCPARLVFDQFADKWSLLIVGLLRRGPMRFNQIKREIEGISQKVLSQVLKKLERDGILSRRAFATVPVTVEYSLTELGRTLSQVIEPLSAWAETHIEQVQAAQARYDASAASRG